MKYQTYDLSKASSTPVWVFPQPGGPCITFNFLFSHSSITFLESVMGILSGSLFWRNLFLMAVPIGVIVSLAFTYCWRRITLFSFDFEMYSEHVDPRNTASNRSWNALLGSKVLIVRLSSCISIELCRFILHATVYTSVTANICYGDIVLVARGHSYF